MNDTHKQTTLLWHIYHILIYISWIIGVAFFIQVFTKIWFFNGSITELFTTTDIFLEIFIALFFNLISIIGLKRMIRKDNEKESQRTQSKV